MKFAIKRGGVIHHGDSSAAVVQYANSHFPAYRQMGELVMAGWQREVELYDPLLEKVLEADGYTFFDVDKEWD